MGKQTVYAVMQVTVEIPVQPSSADETFAQMFDAAKREADDILRTHLSLSHFKVVGEPTFIRAVVKDTK